jgi:hypothetical protein
VQAGDKPVAAICVASSNWDEAVSQQIDVAFAQFNDDGSLDASFGPNTADSDLYPDAFTIPATSAPAGTLGVASGLVSPVGFNSETPVFVSGGEFSIACTGSFANKGFLAPGQSFCVRQDAPTTAGATAQATVTIGSRRATYVTTATTATADTTPDAFTFTAQTGVALNTTVTSNTVTISGINGAASVAVEQGQYSIGCDPQGFTTSRGTITNGQTVCVRHASSTANSTSVSTTLAIGGITATFVSTTLAASGTNTPPPSNNSNANSNSGGGGGALDWWTVLALAALGALSRVRPERSRRAA